MVPARNLLRRHYNNYGAFADFLQEEKSAAILVNSSTMADEEEQEQEQEDQEHQENQEAVAVGSSKTGKEADDSWLQLSIGGGSSSAGTTSQSPRSLELELFTDKPSTMQPLMSAASRPASMAQAVPIFSPHGFGGYRGQWGYWNTSALMNMGGSSSSSSFTLPPPPPPPPPLLPPSLSMPYYTNYPQFGGSSSTTSELRVISPPTRRQAGVWFLLQAAKNQVREPFLPQIPKSYLRIRDGRMTVRLLMKYLVSKLGLDDESEVEICCRGQLLHPYLTLQHVRDSIWCLREAVAFLSDSPADHVMILQYGRSR